jgi:hypothetical protein
LPTIFPELRIESENSPDHVVGDPAQRIGRDDKGRSSVAVLLPISDAEEGSFNFLISLLITALVKLKFYSCLPIFSCQMLFATYLDLDTGEEVRDSGEM